ncbi:hypothetical protein BBJ29_005224 [Phytophthora kernoviae]|uniref:FYVE-type domain-containing protein n=1 Tax=Phytophthora kernoviae TaxID=325452 RepID=A0A3F2S148_9STRA|nr:hypothetical protein BBJ29_005224 [Phytophthora kernoviae]RLN67382.1 hypothetical protein BBP00_00001646 [Phytophthora kernoviae]
MAKDRFMTNPFKKLPLSSVDMDELQVVAETIVKANEERHEQFMEVDNGKVDRSQWKCVKRKGDVRVYLERQQKRRGSSSPEEDATANLESLLCVGSIPGRLDDVMNGVVTSYTNGPNCSVVLSTVHEPTEKDPLRSVVVKWMELDTRLMSMGRVKNRDYVYVETTGVKDLPNGERLGYHVMHSVHFPQTPALPGRIRAQLSVCSFFRQVSEDSVLVYVLGMMDPMNDKARRSVVPKFVKTLLAPLHYPQGSEMKKLAQALGEHYSGLKEKFGPTNSRHSCVTCNKPLRVWHIGKFAKHPNTCKRCFGFVCNSCEVKRELSFMTPDFELTQEKVTFCAIVDVEIVKAKPQVMVEIGTFCGYSAVRFAKLDGLSDIVTFVVGFFSETYTKLKELGINHVDVWSSGGRQQCAIAGRKLLEYLEYVRLNAKFTSVLHESFVEYQAELKDGVEVTIYVGYMLGSHNQCEANGVLSTNGVIYRAAHRIDPQIGMLQVAPHRPKKL